MKISAISGDLAVKVTLGAVALVAAWYVLAKTRTAAGKVADQVITAVNPADPGNVVNRGVTAIGSSIVSDTGPGRNADGSWTLGGWFYDITH